MYFTSPFGSDVTFQPKTTFICSTDIFSAAATTNPSIEKVSTTISSRLWKYCISYDVFPCGCPPLCVHPVCTQWHRGSCGFFLQAILPSKVEHVGVCSQPSYIPGCRNTLLVSSRSAPTACEHLIKENGKFYLCPKNPTWYCTKVSTWSIPNEGIRETLWKYFGM